MGATTQHVIVEQKTEDKRLDENNDATLTPRQKEIVQMLLRGKTYKGISKELNISRRTVETHIYEVRRRTGTHTKSELALLANRNPSLFAVDGKAPQGNNNQDMGNHKTDVNLTPRQIDILRQILRHGDASTKGVANNIASELNIHLSTKTIDVHMQNLFKAIGVHSRAELILFADSNAKLLEAPKPKLTQRDKEILGMLAQGLSRREMANWLNIKYLSVHRRISNIYKKLGFASSIELAVWAKGNPDMRYTQVADTNCADPCNVRLTNRERDVLKHVIKGKSSKEIAYELGISAKTAYTHISNMFSKSKVNSKLRLALWGAGYFKGEADDNNGVDRR